MSQISAYWTADQFELGNQSRHTLDGTSIRHSKARALANRLKLLQHHIFNRGASHERCRQPTGRWRQAWTAADFLIDCTANEGAFLWLSRFAKSIAETIRQLVPKF